MSDKCQKCGAERNKQFPELSVWLCGSSQVPGLQVVESTRCLRNQLAQRDATLNWICRKLEIPEGSQLASSEITIAGRLHVVCAHAKGYTQYIEAYKCEDKQGEIARLSVQLAQRDAEIERLGREWTYLRAACQYIVDHHADQPIEEFARYARDMMDECDKLEAAKADDE